MIRRAFNHPTVKQFSRFVLIGFLNTGLDWAIFFALTSWIVWFGNHILVANTISFLFGFASSFTFNRRWTFRSTDPQVTKQLTTFLLINLVGLGMNLGIVGVVYHASHSRLLSKTLAVVIVLFWNYLAGRKFAFKK
jgi:putative flippase GtrA